MGQNRAKYMAIRGGSDVGYSTRSSFASTQARSRVSLKCRWPETPPKRPSRKFGGISTGKSAWQRQSAKSPPLGRITPDSRKWIHAGHKLWDLSVRAVHRRIPPVQTPFTSPGLYCWYDVQSGFGIKFQHHHVRHPIRPTL